MCITSDQYCPFSQHAPNFTNSLSSSMDFFFFKKNHCCRQLRLILQFYLCWKLSTSYIVPRLVGNLHIQQVCKRIMKKEYLNVHFEMTAEYHASPTPQRMKFADQPPCLTIIQTLFFQINDLLWWMKRLGFCWSSL